jgi:hypothetical protein
MINQFIQNIFYHYILSDPGLTLKMNPDFFDTKNLQLAFQIAKEYVIKYHSAPSVDQMKQLTRVDGKDTILTDDILDILYSAKDSLRQYTNDWLYDNVTSWAQWKNFINSLRNTIAYVKLNQDNVSVENVKEIMEHAKGSFNKSCIIEFDDSLNTGSDFWDASSHKQVQLKRSSTGYPFIDLCLKGGYFPGILVCFVGAPKSGKSLWMQNLCAASVKHGENNAYISLELPEEMIHTRIGSNMFNIPSMEYDDYANDEARMKERIQSFKKSCLIPPGQLIVKSFPTSTMSVIDLETYLLSKEEELSTETQKFKFKNVFVDYINIMKNYRNPNSENTYMKIKQLAEDLKAMGLKNGWAIITATQTTRSQYETNDMSPNQVAESVGLGATVDAMFGIIADSIMKAQGKYFLKCMYDRVAPEDNKRKLFNNDKTYLRITEDMSAPIEEVLTPIQVPGTYQGYGNKQSQKVTYNTTTPGQDNSITQSVPILSDKLELVDNSSQPGMPGTSFSNNMISVTGAGLF